MASLAELSRERSIVVCCGSGGVGKTTTAAAMAVEAARQGRVACVVTIDPARRLADALGLEELTDTPSRVQGVGPGELWALMLDTKSTFDSVVRRYAGGETQAEAILSNRLYRNISGALSGTQEYMAMEKIYELSSGSGGQEFDVVVVDTPPTRNALDFIDAPRRLSRFLDNRVFRLLIMPTRAYLRVVSIATQVFLRTVTKVVGGQVVSDALAFFEAFEGMEQGFRDRADAVLRLLADPTTAFVLVASPRRDAVEEALYFADKLGEAGIKVEALIVNRLHPQFPAASRDADSAPEGSALATLERNLAELNSVAEREAGHLFDLTQRVAPAPVTGVPLLPGDVHDLTGLAAIGEILFERTESASEPPVP